jgi:hypothetical protein
LRSGTPCWPEWCCIDSRVLIMAWNVEEMRLQA